MRSWGLITLLVFLAFYVALAGEVSVPETAAMFIAVASALALSVAIHRVDERRFDLHVPWMRLVSGTGAALVRDSLNVGLFLLRSVWRAAICISGLHAARGGLSLLRIPAA